MPSLLFDRFVVFLVLEVAHLLFVLTTVDARPDRLSPSAVALLIVVDTIVLAGCAWLPWFAARRDTVMRLFGAVLLIASTAAGLSSADHPAGFVALACLGLMLLADGLGRRAAPSGATPRPTITRAS